MDEGILSDYLDCDQLVYGRTTHQPWNHLRISGCNNTRAVMVQYRIDHPDIPEECRHPGDDEPAVIVTGGRQGPADCMMYTDIVRCPTLDANARVIQRAWRRFDYGCFGSLA